VRQETGAHARSKGHGRGQAREAPRQRRIRWLDEHGRRQSAVHDDYKFAQTELRRHQVEVEEIKRGLRNAAPPDKTFAVEGENDRARVACNR